MTDFPADTELMSNAGCCGSASNRGENSVGTPELSPAQFVMQQVIEQAPDPILVAEGDGTLVYVNSRAGQLFGYTTEELLGQNVKILIPPMLWGVHDAHLARLRETQTAPIFGVGREVPGVRRDGTELLLELHVKPLVADGQPRYIATLRDIAERKRAATQVQNLADRLSTQNGELKRLHQEAQAANVAKSEFLSNMSHEIRTPLTAILGYAELLCDDPELAASAEQRGKILKTIRSAGRHLLDLINDILDLSRIEAGKLEVETVETPVIQILAEVESLLRPHAIGKGIGLRTELTGSIPKSISSDPTRLRQILLNLAGNAVKFTRQGEVTISVRVDETATHRQLIIEVQDSGEGIRNDQASRLFAPFMQGNSSVTRDHGGTGLGLVISRRLARLMHGDVMLVWSEVGQGSKFRFQLPCVRIPGVPEVTSLTERPVDNGLVPGKPLVFPTLSGTILLAEDGPDNQRLISFILKKAGATVIVAEHGQEALERLLQADRAGDTIDLLITDMQMPVMDGYSLARTLRQRASRLPIIAMTAHAMAGDREKCLAAGCNDYISKPVDRASLLAICQRHLPARPTPHTKPSAGPEGDAPSTSMRPEVTATPAVAN